ncbi:MAG: hypothetical protein KDA65_04845 [Planctomycetaceae bacterium]|nr:hypothetical protein [Planctomycetaceae bacterium]
MPSEPTELELFRDFLIEECKSEKPPESVEKAVRKFEQTQRLKAMLDETAAEAERGEYGPLDIEEVKRGIRERFESAKQHQ